MALQPYAPEAAGGGDAVLRPYDPTEVAAGSTKITAPLGAALATAPALTGKRVNVVAPDGTAYSVDEGELGAVAARGWRPETSTERDVREYVEENKGVGGAAKVFLRGLADEAAFGVLDPILDHTSDPLDRAKWDAVKKENTAANIVGRGLGFGLSLLYGGEFAKGAQAAGHVAERAVLAGAERAASKTATAETYRALAGAVESRMLTAGVPAAEAAAAAPGFARKLVANAAKYGTESVAFVAPKAVTEAALGDPEQAGETIVSALGAGALLGLAGGVAGAGFKGLLAGAEKGLPKGAAGWVEDAANKQAFRSLASNQASLGKVFKDLEGQYGENVAAEVGTFLRKEGLLKKFREGEVEYLRRFEKTHEKIGQDIGDLYATVAQKSGEAGRIKAEEFLDRMVERVVKPLEEGAGAVGNEALRKRVMDFAESFVQQVYKTGRKDGTLAIDEAHKFINEAINKKVDWKRALSTDDFRWNEALAEMSRASRDVLLTRAEQAANGVGETFLPQIKALNKRYGIASGIKEGLEDYVYRESKNRVLSPTDNGAGWGGALMGLVSGSPTTAMVTGPLMALGHHVLRTEGNALAARALGSVAEGGGLLVAEQAMKRAAERLDALPKALGGMAKPATRATAPTNILSRFVDADPSFRKADKATQVTILADRLASLASNPAELHQHVEELVGPFSADAPTVATQAGAKATALVHHLASVAPKAPSVPSPFVAAKPWKPTPKQVSEFELRLGIAVDPMSAIDRLAGHQITPAEVDTLRVLYPKLYQRMVAKVAEASVSGKAPALPFAGRAALSRFMPAPVDASMSPARVAAYQATFKREPVQGGGGGKPMKTPTMQTDAERVALG